MIRITLKSKRQVILPPVIPFKQNNLYPNYSRQVGDQIKTVLEFENLVRISMDLDKLVRNAAKECKYKVGDTVYLAKAAKVGADYDHDTPMEVIDIIDQYARYPYALEWPKHNNPFIVRVKYIPNVGKNNIPFLMWGTNTYFEVKENANESKEN